MKTKTNTYAGILSVLLIGLQLGDCEEKTGKYKTVEVSKEKVFIFEKIGLTPPKAIEKKYKVTNLENNLLQVVDVLTNKKIYEVKAPAITDLNPFLNGVFSEAWVLASGDLMLHYLGSDFFIYRRESQKFNELPSYFKQGDMIYQLGIISECSTDNHIILAARLKGKANRCLVYEMSSERVYELKISSEFKLNYILERLDDRQGVVEVKTFTTDENDPESDMEITGSLGWYRIVQEKVKIK